MFPTANSSIIRNEDGEVLGWDNHTFDEAPDVDEYYERMDSVGYAEPAGPEECIEQGSHLESGSGTDVDGVYLCDYCCDGYGHLTDDGRWFYLTNDEFRNLRYNLAYFEAHTTEEI